MHLARGRKVKVIVRFHRATALHEEFLRRTSKIDSNNRSPNLPNEYAEIALRLHWIWPRVGRMLQ